MNLAYESNLEQITEDLLKQADEVIKQEPPKEPVYPVMPQGQLATMIIRKKEDLIKVPPQFLPMVSDKDGNPLPHWQQVANLMNRPHKKVAIVGFADTKMEAPFDNKDWEIWGLNDLHASLPRYDRWFDIHTLENIQEDYKLLRNQGQTPPENIGLAGLKKLNVPVYMQDICADVPNSIKFPLKEVTEAFPFGRYMTNSISYMIALAIYEGFEEIFVAGVDMAVGTEYVNQRPSCEYWLGIAAGRNIKLTMPTASDLLKCRFMYAFETVKQHAFQDKIDSMLKNMSQRHGMISQQEQQAHDARMQYEGAMGCVKEINKVWANLDDKL